MVCKKGKDDKDDTVCGIREECIWGILMGVYDGNGAILEGRGVIVELRPSLNKCPPNQGPCPCVIDGTMVFWSTPGVWEPCPGSSKDGVGWLELEEPPELVAVLDAFP